ncbi:MAG: HDOD domain-containing protein [Gammaproteobacteria bacterium]|nr:HDOD domain-containing protein [Gammaproteobacteria bacterium]
MSTISDVVQIEVGQLPSVPRVLLKLIDACHKVDVSYEELGAIIRQDPALSAKVIAIANSPAGVRQNDIRDFNQQLAVLGLNTIRTIGITSAVHQFFSRFDTRLGLWMGNFWHGSLTCACIARAMARLTGYDSVDEAYFAGLLHKIGRMVLFRRDPLGYPQVLNESLTEAELDAQEQTLFGVTGSEVGAAALKEWVPDSFLGDSVLYQDASAEAVLDTPRLVKLVNFAHKLGECGTPADRLFDEAGLLFGLARPVIEDMLQGVRAEVKQAAAGLDIRLGGVKEGVYDADTEEIRLELAKKVREFALLDGVHQHLNDSEQLDPTVVALLQDLRILFGLSRSLVFLVEADGVHLQAVAGNVASLEQIREFQIPFKQGRSLVTEALLGRSVLSTFDEKTSKVVSVVDGQLAELMDAGGILCIPLHRPEQDVGVLVAGIDPEEGQGLGQQTELLRLFSLAAATAVNKCRLLIQDRQGVLEHERERQQRQISRLAHEANNPLAIIKNYLQVLSVRLAEDRGIQEHIDILGEEIERVAGIVLRMRDVSGSVERLQGAVDINQMVKDLIGIFRVSHFSTQNIREKLLLDTNLPLIITNRNGLKQILTNLIRNAVESLPKGGRLSIATCDRVNVNGTQFVELIIEDDGPGIPLEVMEGIFNPVSSAKGREHSGLGLTIVRNLVLSLDGSVSCRNKPKGGAEFVILLPRKTDE